MQNFVQTVYYSAESFLEKPHFHDCHQIILILKGQVLMNSEGILGRDLKK